MAFSENQREQFKIIAIREMEDIAMRNFLAPKAKGCGDIKPWTWHRSYSNPECQGSLITATSTWTGKTRKGESVSSAYIDRMESWDRNRFSEMVQMMGGKPGQQCGIDSLAERSSEETLLKAASHYFKRDVIAVRWVYFYNVSNGYPCERIDVVHRDE